MRAQQHHAPVQRGRFLEPPDVLAGVRRVADDGERHVGAYVFERVDDELRVVLRLESADVEHVTARPEPESSERAVVRLGLEISAVREVVRLPAVRGAIEALDDTRIGYQLDRSA